MSGDLHERLVEAAGGSLRAPDLLAGWRRGLRQRRQRRLRRLVTVGVGSGLVVSLVLIAITGSGSSPQVTTAAEANGRFSDPIHGLSVTIPKGWHRAQHRLAPTIDPQELLSVGTISFPPNNDQLLLAEYQRLDQQLLNDTQILNNLRAQKSANPADSSVAQQFQVQQMIVDRDRVQLTAIATTYNDTFPLTNLAVCDQYSLLNSSVDVFKPTDIYLIILERHFSGSATSPAARVDPTRYPARPSNFASAHLNPLRCGGSTSNSANIRRESYFFRTGGRVIGFYLATGRAVTPQRRIQIWQLLNSLRLTPQPSSPAAVASGPEQVIISTDPPADVADVFQRPLGEPLVPGSTAYGFSVNLGLIFVAADIDTTSYPSGGPPPQPPRACTFSEGTLAQGGQGTGIDSGPCVPLSALSTGGRAAVFVIPDFPKPPQYSWAWTHLPSGTAFVTFTAGTTQFWERPTADVAGFIADFQGANPTLRAYNAHGNLLAQVTAPRFLGDPVTPVGGLEQPR